MITPSPYPAIAHAVAPPSRFTNVLLIVNPGSRAGRQYRAAVMDALGDAHVHVVETAAPSHATAIVREQLSANPRAYDTVLTLGGDGTAMEVATALAEFPDGPPLGIVPLGTANVLARTLGIPMHPSRAISALRDAETVAIDVGDIDGGPTFAIGLGIGLDVAMIAGASPSLKRRFGYLAYGVSALGAGLRLERFGASITVDGVVHRVEASSILVANFGSVIGDLLCFGEGIGHQDGVINVCVYSPRTHLDAVRIFWRMLRGGMSGDRNVRILSGREIRIDTDRPRPMQADGELIGETPVSLRVVPGAVRLLVPHVGPRRWRIPRLPVSHITPALLKVGT